MKRPVPTLALLLVSPFLLGALPVAASEAGPPDPIAEHVFPPDLVMAHGREIGLDERQRTAIKEAIQSSQSKFLDAQWAMQEESQKLVQLLQARPVDESAVLAQADRVMSLERDVKRAQLGLLVRIKNLLSDRQQARLADLRKASAR
jgi:Spy/CpxP family protein refolding chaperone